jgi:hypothetical protein
MKTKKKREEEKPPTLREGRELTTENKKGRRVIHLPLHFLSITTKKNPMRTTI